MVHTSYCKGVPQTRNPIFGCHHTKIRRRLYYISPGRRYILCRRHTVHQAMPSMIGPQTSVKVVGGYGTSLAHTLAMAFDDPSMDDDLRETLDADEIMLGEEWAAVE